MASRTASDSARERWNCRDRKKLRVARSRERVVGEEQLYNPNLSRDFRGLLRPPPLICFPVSRNRNRPPPPPPRRYLLRADDRSSHESRSQGIHISTERVALGFAPLSDPLTPSTQQRHVTRLIILPAQRTENRHEVTIHLPSPRNRCRSISKRFALCFHTSAKHRGSETKNIVATRTNMLIWKFRIFFLCFMCRASHGRVWKHTAEKFAIIVYMCVNFVFKHQRLRRLLVCWKVTESAPKCLVGASKFPFSYVYGKI